MSIKSHCDVQSAAIRVNRGEICGLLAICAARGRAWSENENKSRASVNQRGRTTRAHSRGDSGDQNGRLAREPRSLAGVSLVPRASQEPAGPR